MITVEEARDIIRSKKGQFGTTSIDTTAALGRILQQDIKTDRPLPPYHRVTMDGIAIQYDSFTSGRNQFKIEAVAAAGSAQLTLQDKNNCIEVMTGAVLPIACDTVIRYEDVDIENDTAKLHDINLVKEQNIHFEGSDRPQANVVVRSGSVMTPVEIGIAASTGHTTLDVSEHPRVAIISTGDELVNIDQSPAPYQIRRSNVHMIQTALAAVHIDSSRYHLADDYDAVRQALEKLVKEYDVLILSGGVSKGKFDFLPKALAELGVTKLFHKIKQRPGKPFWFGELEQQCTVFALPGNPVSSFMCTVNYVLPWFALSLEKQESTEQYAVLAEDIHFKPDLSYFPIVKLRSTTDDLCLAEPVNNNGSGDFASLADGNAFLELPRGQDLYKKGSIYRCLIYKNINNC